LVKRLWPCPIRQAEAAPRVARAEELGEIDGVEGDQVTDLMTLGLEDRHLVARLHAPQARVAGRDHELARRGAHVASLLA
jgi:hypothetical protein